MTTIVRPSSGAEVGPQPAPGDQGSPAQTVALVAVLAVGAAAGAVAGAAPTDWGPADLILDAVVVVVVTWAATRASTTARLVLLVPAVLLTTGWLRGWALLGLVLVGLAARSDQRRPDGACLAGAAAAIGVNVLLRLPLVEVAPLWEWSSAPTGSTAIVGVVACAVVLLSAWRRSGPVVRRRMRWIVLALAGYVAIATVGFGVAAVIGRAPMGRGIYLAQHGLDAAERGNQPAAAIDLQSSSSEFARAHRSFDAPWAWPARLVPVLGYYAKAATRPGRGRAHRRDRRSARRGSEVPYDRITAKPGQIDLDLLRSIVGPVTRADAGMREATYIVDQVDTSWFLPPLMTRFASYREHLDTALPEADRALEAVRLAPDLLGSGGTRNYLVLFGNPAESRLLGGYAGAYGLLTASNGHLSLSRSGRTQDLPASTTAAAVPRGAGLARGGATRPPATRATSRPPTTSPPWPGRRRRSFGGRSASTSTACCTSTRRGWPRCSASSGGSTSTGCAYPLNETNLAPFLVHDQYTLFPERSGRFDFLSATARQTFHLLTTRSIGSPMKLFQQLAPAVRGGHLLLWFDDAPSARLLDEVGVSGRLDRVRGGDVFDLRSSNLSQNKTDAFLQRSVDYVATVDRRTGVVGADVTIQLHNGAPRTSSPYVLSNQWLRVHVPGAPPYGSDTLLVSLSTTMSLDRASVDGASTPMSDHATQLGEPARRGRASIRGDRDGPGGRDGRRSACVCTDRGPQAPTASRSSINRWPTTIGSQSHIGTEPRHGPWSGSRSQRHARGHGCRSLNASSANRRRRSTVGLTHSRRLQIERSKAMSTTRIRRSALVLFAFVAATIVPTLVAAPRAEADPVIAYPSLRIKMPTNAISISTPTQSTRVLDFTHITWNAGAGPARVPTDATTPTTGTSTRGPEPVHADRPQPPGPS